MEESLTEDQVALLTDRKYYTAGLDNKVGCCYVKSMKPYEDGSLECWNCQGTGRRPERILRVEGVSHRKIHTTQCATCNGSGRVEDPRVGPNAPQVISDFPDWMCE